MAITTKGIKSYEGRVIRIEDHMWSDGMYEEWAVIWNPETHSEERHTVGYYGSDCNNLCGDTFCEVEVSPEIARDILRTKTEAAERAFAEKVELDRNTVRKGDRAEVVRGRKVKKGTQLEIFWIGDRLNYMGTEYEKIAGCYDKDHNKVWIKAEYLKPLTEREEPTAEEKEDFIENYVERHTDEIVRLAAQYNKTMIMTERIA
jgi:hypothetical protein